MPLPQNHAWQVDLRSWLSERVVADFECGLPGLSYDDSYFSTPDDLYRHWLTFEDNRGLPDISGFKVSASHFVLSNIERDGKVYLRPKAPFADMSSLAFYHSWDYPGNPYKDSAPIAKRALVLACVDMMMLDAEHEAGRDAQSNYAGFSLSAWGYVWDKCGHLLPVAVQDAYKEGMRRVFERIQEWGPTGTQADMDQPAHIGLWYAGQALGGDYPARAEAYSLNLHNEFFKAWYVDHGGGMDPSYGGIAILYLAWAAHLTGYPFLVEAVDKFSRLKAFMSMPEPYLDSDELKVYRGPSSFSTNTAWGSPLDQKWTYYRDAACAMISDHAVPLMFQSRTNQREWYTPFGEVPEDKMRSGIADVVYRTGPDAFKTWTTPSDTEPLEWIEAHWHVVPPYISELYQPALRQKVLDAVGTDAALLPFERQADFIEQFGDEFVIWKLNGFGGVIHTGPLSWWNADTKLPGLSGGSLCALWSAKGGIGLLGRQAGYAGSTPDTMETMPTWAAHHVYGTIAGEQLSSARERNPSRSIIIDGAENALVMVSGLIGDVQYVRKFDISAAGVQVSLELDTAGFSDLWESLPFYLGESEATDGRLQFLVDGLWIDATTEPVTATAAKLDRGGYITLMELEQPGLLRLSDHVWTTAYQVKSRIRSVQVDAMGGNVRYTLSGAYKQELVKA